MTPIINSRADLDALRGTDVYSDALRAILGATMTWVNNAPEGEEPIWEYVSVGETLAHLDLTLDELLAECAAAGIAPTNPPGPVTPHKPAPSQVPMWAVRTVLSAHNLFEQAEQAIAASSDVALKNVWEYGNFAVRNSAAIATLAASLNLTDEQVDALFFEADALVV